MRSQTDPQRRERSEVSLRRACPELGELGTFSRGGALLVAEKPCG